VRVQTAVDREELQGTNVAALRRPTRCHPSLVQRHRIVAPGNLEVTPQIRLGDAPLDPSEGGDDSGKDEEDKTGGSDDDGDDIPLRPATLTNGGGCSTWSGIDSER